MNSPKFEQFLEEFMEAYKCTREQIFDKVYEFVEEEPCETLNLELVAVKDVLAYNSYGDEDSKLQRVYRHKELDILISFEGTRCSYEGEEWTTVKEVSEISKTIIVYE